MSPQCTALKERYEQLKAEGLEDIKFVFGPLGERTLEDVCASINEVLDAIERQDYVDFPVEGEPRRK
jgi:hypothetical protein